MQPGGRKESPSFPLWLSWSWDESDAFKLSPWGPGWRQAGVCPWGLSANCLLTCAGNGCYI